MRMLDLFSGRWGWSRAFADRGWECVGVDLVEPPEIPQGCEFIHADILNWTAGLTVATLCQKDS
jgi:23S rRNA U2552 (ribose-2'-O)-methylase RlmE/FtsJ